MPAQVITDLEFVVTVDADSTVLTDTSILVVDGAISAIGPAAELLAAHPGATRVDGRRKLALPGLVNLRTHLPMTLLRGLAEDVDLQGFLRRIWAAEGAVMEPASVELGAELGALESLRSGSTTQLDMYFHHAEAHRGAVTAGARHVLGPVFFAGPGPDGLDWRRRLEGLRDWPARLRAIGGADIPLAACPHSTYATEPDQLRELALALRAHGFTALTIHASENHAENRDVLERFGRTPVQLLADVGLFDAGLHVTLGHGVRLDAQDQATVAAAGAAVAHCPGSNLKLASGALPWRTYADAGIRLGLGTDGCSSSNDLDMWSVMRLAGLLARLTSARPDAVSAVDIVRAATIEGARALGLGDTIGSIEVGKSADLVLLDLDAAHLTPVHDVHALLVYAAGRGDVTDVFVAGERVVAHRESTRVDEHDLYARCRERGAVAAAAAANAP